ncbi:U3 snoRNP protein [Thecaphora frezii]
MKAAPGKHFKKQRSSLQSGSAGEAGPSSVASSAAASPSQPQQPAKKKLTREQAHRKAQKQAAKQRQAQQEASGIAAFGRQKSLKAINKNAEKVSTRFRYASFNQRLQDVHLAPAAISSSASYRPMAGLDNPLALQGEPAAGDQDHDADELSLHGATAFSKALATWFELNQSLPFQRLYQLLWPVTQSLPQLIHHRAKVCSALTDCLARPSEWLTWDAALDLLPRLANDLGSEFLPVYPQALRAAIHVTTTTKAVTAGDERAAALIVERGFQCSAWILKAVSPLVISKDRRDAELPEDAAQMDIDADEQQPADEVEVDERTERLVQTWNIVRPYLGWKVVFQHPKDALGEAKADADADADDGSEAENDEDEDEADAADGEAEDELRAEASGSRSLQSSVHLNVSKHTRRFASEAFAHLMRKTRGRQLDNIIAVMLRDLEEMMRVEDETGRYVGRRRKRPSSSFSRGIAGIWAEGCKSLEKRLHSKTSSLLQGLFRSSSTSGKQPQQRNYAHVARLTVGRLTLIALVHHSQASFFTPVVELLIDLVEKRRQSLEDLGSAIDGEKYGDQAVVAAIESIEWLATAAGVRKGTRLSDDVKGELFALLVRLSPLLQAQQQQALSKFEGYDALRTSLVTLFALSLPTGRIQDLIGPGVKLIDSMAPAGVLAATVDRDQRLRLWPEFSGLVEALADPAVAWTGFRQFALPTVLTATAATVSRTAEAADPASIAAAKDQALNLLERLHSIDQLGHLRIATPSPNLVRWNNAVATEILSRLETLADLLCETAAQGDAAVFPSSRDLEPLLPALELATLPQSSSTTKYPALLVRIVRDGLVRHPALTNAATAEAIYDRQTINPALLLGSALQSLAIFEERNQESKTLVSGDLLLEGNAVQRVLGSCSWHRNAIAGLARLATASHGKAEIQLPRLADAESSLEKSVMVGDPMVRLAALEILRLIDLREFSRAEDRLFGKMADVERTPLTALAVRDRNVRMRAVGRELGKLIAGYGTQTATDEERAWRQVRDRLAIRYIVGSFKVNLSPIWPESIKALEDIVGSGNVETMECIFNTAFTELERGTATGQEERTSVPAEWQDEFSPEGGDVDEDDGAEGEDARAASTAKSAKLGAEELEVDDDDRQFMDPQLARRRSAIRICIGNARSSRGASRASGAASADSARPAENAISTTIAKATSLQTPDARLDLLNYRAQILKLFGELHQLVEKYNARFIDTFLHDSGPKNLAGFSITSLEEEEDEDEAKGQSDDEAERASLSFEERALRALTNTRLRLSRKDRQAQLCAYLKVFTKVKNPKSFARSDELHDYFMRLCSSPDLAVQRLAVDAMLNYKEDGLVPYAAQLRDLLDTAKFRDTLTKFDISADSETIQEAHRPTLMPVVIRLFFGMMLSKRGSRGSGQRPSARKGAVLSALIDSKTEELVTLIDLMLASLDDQRPSYDATGRFVTTKERPANVSFSRQLGFLTMLTDVLKHLSMKLLPYWGELVGVIVNLTHHANVAVQQTTANHAAAVAAAKQASAEHKAEGDGESQDNGDGNGGEVVVRSLTRSTARARALRQAGYKRLCDFFRKPTTASEQFAWSAFLPEIFATLVSPRLTSLRVESTQNPSALMDLIHVWAQRPETIRLLAIYDGRILPEVFAVMSVPSVKPPTVSRVLDIVERVLEAASVEAREGVEALPPAVGAPDDVSAKASVKELLVMPHVSSFLSNIAPLLQNIAVDQKASAREDLVRREIGLLSNISPLVTSAKDASQLLLLLQPLMRKSNHLVPERTKSDLLQIFGNLLAITPEFQDVESPTFKRTFELFSGLFSSLRGKEARASLVTAYSRFGEMDSRLSRACSWVVELNAFSVKRLEEPDFDRRLNAFDQINDDAVEVEFAEWAPLVHNMLFFIQDPEELAIRSNAAACLRKFVAAVSAVMANGHATAGGMEQLFSEVVWPGLKRGLRSKSELVRREVLGVVSVSVQKLGHIGALDEMRGLLMGDDQEANFFNNIHHIQMHRRSRAIRRLGEEADRGRIKSKTIQEIFTPLIGTFFHADKVELTDHNLMFEAATCLGKLAKQLNWGPYNQLLWSYLKFADGEGSSAKIFVRAAMAIIEGFHFGMDEEVEMDAAPVDVQVKQEDNELEVDAQDPATGTAAEAMDVDPPAAAFAAASATAAELMTELVVAKPAPGSNVSKVTVVEAVTKKLLPALMKYLEQKDEMEDTVRLPIAYGVVHVVQCLPEHTKAQQLSKLLRTLANVLRSKSVQTRDLARETISKVLYTLGSDFLPEMLHELRRSLTRGPQLAVLSYSVHKILVYLMTTEPTPLTTLTKGVKDIVEVTVEDIFGETAEDRESIGGKTSYKEVRNSKSMDTFEQVAKIIMPTKVSEMLQPLRDILQQTEQSNSIKNVESALRKVASGISANAHFDSHKFLILCATLLKRDAGFLQARKPEMSIAKKHTTATYNYAVLMKRKDVESADFNREHYSRNAHKFVAFGLDLLVTALRRSRFDFGDTEVLAKLNSLVPIVGETMYASEPAVLQLSLQTVGAILKCPVSQVDKALPLLIKQIFVIIKRSGSAQSEIVQTAFRTLATILRDCKQAEVREQQLTTLLNMIAPDLEEPAVQSTLFSLLRAIVGRRFVVPEVYDVMDKVAEMLVTNQSGHVRGLCRATYLQFLLDYPQGKARLKNQLSFLAKNLSYEYESGRLSVMELLAAIFDKFGDELLQEHADMFFVALAMVLANDTSAKCRERGAALLKGVYAVMSDEQRAKTVQMVHAWASQDARPELARVGVQVYGLLLEAAPEEAAGWSARALEIVGRTLSECADDLEALESTEQDAVFSAFDQGAASSGLELDWQLPYQSLQLLSKLQGVDAAALLSVSTDEVARTAISAVCRLLLFPHNWVRKVSSRLLGSLYGATEAVAPRMVAMDQDPIASFPALVDTAKKLSLQLRSPVLDDELSLQAVKNLVWIGKCLLLFPVDASSASAPSISTTGKKRRASTSAEEQGVDDQDDDGEDDGDDDAESDVESVDSDELPETVAKLDDAATIAADPVRWLFSKLSHQARTCHLARPNKDGTNGSGSEERKWSIQPASIFRWFAAMATSMETERLKDLLKVILLPLVKVADDTTVVGQQMDDLKSLVTEVQTLLQTLVSTSDFSSVYTSIRLAASEKRQARKTARLMQSIQAPEKAARKKAKMNEKKHAARKRKNQAFADKKSRVKAGLNGGKSRK